MNHGDVRVFPNLEDASRALAAAVADALRRADAKRGRATLVLSGGATPRRFHEMLAREQSGLPWPRTHVFWGDERCVPHDSPQSNYRMARETLLDDVPIPPENVHPYDTSLPEPEDTALSMQAEMEELFGRDGPRFDVMILGMGGDGHTASLFPNSPALGRDDRWAVPALAPDEPRQRVTMTIPVINRSRAVHFLVAGAGKREALQCALAEEHHPQRCPASLVQPEDGTLTWWLDEDVAEGLHDASAP